MGARTNQAAARPGFQTEAREAVVALQQAMSAVVDAIAGGSDRRLTDIAAALGIDTKLAWKITRILELHDPYAAGLYMPGASGIRILSRAATEKGVDAGTVRGLEEASRGFEQLQRTHAGDRRTLDMLLSGLAEEEQDRHDLQQRKDAFHANASLWGVSAGMRLMAFVVRGSRAHPDRLEVAHIAGLFGISRTRPNVPWRVAQLRAEDEAGDVSRPAARRPVDPGVPAGVGPPVLRAFTSLNAPELVPLRTPDGRTEYRLGEGPIGRRSSFDLVLAEYLADAGPVYRTEQDDQISVTSRNRTPAERLVLDLIVERDLYGPLSPTPTLVSELWGERPPTDPDDPERLPLHEKVGFAGRGLSAFHHRHVPRHRELMAHVFHAQGWEAERFDTYRIEMQYPPAPTALRLVHPLPVGPG
jgi:hypothetical protein